ncbi:MAG: ribonuclease HII [Bacteroidaceae bacterium]|nr:ribonuclease HII [Bacteroidaceae bacterium]
MLKPYLNKDLIEAGCDEAGRGCLAGPVFAAAVILPFGESSYAVTGEGGGEGLSALNDSKQLTERQRYQLREVIEREAVAWAVGIVTNEEIDRINILRASILAMHCAVAQLKVRPEHLLIDGNRFMPYEDIPYTTVVKGDATYMSIAAASILAKTYRDDFMLRIHRDYPQYHWDRNKGYPAPVHREAIRLYGTTPHHRMTFNLLGTKQLELDFGE